MTGQAGIDHASAIALRFYAQTPMPGRALHLTFALARSAYVYRSRTSNG
jgi:hypothetical protein